MRPENGAGVPSPAILRRLSVISNCGKVLRSLGHLRAANKKRRRAGFKQRYDPLHALRGLVRNWTACAQHLLRIAARPFLTVDARWLNTDTRASVSTPNVGFWPDADIPQRQLLRRLFGVKMG
jgi:hypothetical protein